MRRLSLGKLCLVTTAALFTAACIPAPKSKVQYPDNPEVVYSARIDTRPKMRGNAELRNVMLKTHNAARHAVGAKPLLWDNNLAVSAADYAREMARTDKFQHDHQEGIAVRQGENLWMGTRDAFSYAEMSGSWIDEKRYFKRGPFPNSSTSGQWSDVAHYTQIIWATTTRMGCALASNRSSDYLVCRYSPAGNIYGRDPLKG